MSEPKGDAGQEGTKEQAMQLVRDLYEYFQGPHACGDFTCACGDVKSCGVCEMRVRTEKFLAEVPVSAPVPERTNRESALRLAYRAFEHLYDVDARNRRGQWQYSMGLFRTALSLAAPVPEPEDEPEYCNAGPSRNIPIEEMRAVLAENEVSADTLGRKYVTEMIDNIRANVGEDKARRSEPPARKDELGTPSWAEETMRIINDLTPDIKGKAFDADWFLLRKRLEEFELVKPVAPQASPEALKEMVILRPCKCGHGWESHEPERCNESLCRCEEFRPEASPEAPAKVKLGTCKFGPIGNKRPHVRGSSCENWTSVAPALE